MSSSQDIPANIGLTIVHRWMAVHFTSSETNISSWVDETNAFTMSLIPGASSTTNSVNGVWLDATHCFVQTNVFTDASKVVLLIFDSINDFDSKPNTSILQDASRGAGFGYDLTGIDHTTVRINPNASAFQSSGFILTNFWNNVITFGANSAYTNGVSMALGGLTLVNFSGNCNVGCLSLNNNGMRGYLKELITFNESTATASQISNLNYYAQVAHYPWHNP